MGFGAFETPMNDLEASKLLAWKIDESGAIVTGFQSAARRVKIPETLGGAPVKRLEGVGKKTSPAAANLCGLWFPDSLETIGEGALARYSALAFVRFGANLREIQPFAFYSCAELRELDFRATRLETIDDDAFFGCSSVVSLFFPATLRSIGSSAFSGCVKIAHVDAPRDSLDVDVKPYAFRGVRAPLQVVDGKLKLGAEKLRFQPSTSFR
ncbi:MAG: leucine-rich repeat domain-containing protein [Thermoguttaceae bacterium]